MYRRNLDIAVAGGTALLGGAAFLAHAPGAIQVILGVALFFAPGYLWSEAILSQRLPGIERTLTSAGMAFILPILGGFLFYALGIPLFRSAWVGLLVVLTLLGVVAVAVQRLRQVPADEREQLGNGRRPGRVRVSPLHVFISVVAAAIALGTVGFSVKSAEAQKFPGYTDLWMTPLTDNSLKASLGVTNYQGVTEKYELKLLKKGKVSDTWPITLAEGQTWQRTIAYTVAYGDGMVANLYLLPNVTTPFRTADNGQQVLQSPSPTPSAKPSK